MLEFSLIHILMLFAGGAVAGFVNTLAGGGSFLTIPLLMFAGLPPTVANATNRVGVFMQSLTATREFHSQGVFPWRFGFNAVIPAVIGSIIGTWGALLISDAAFKKVIAVFMILMTLVTFYKPDAKERLTGEIHGLLLWVFFFLIGIYGGFIQAGVGFLIMAAVVLAGQDMVAGTAVKSFVILVLTVVSLLIFSTAGKIWLVPGLALGAGSALGAYVGSRVTVAKGNEFIRRFVLAAVLISALMLLLG